MGYNSVAHVRKGYTMKLDSVKETKVAGLICGSIECEHGKVDVVFEGWGGNDETAQYLARYVIDFSGEYIQLHESCDENFCHGNFKSCVNSFTSCCPYVPFDWDEMAPCMCEYAEAFQLLASAAAYINRMLFNA